MQDEHNEINTLETLGVTPRFVLQHNAISRSIHKLSATAKKLTAMAMALIPPDLSSLSAAFTFTEFCKAVGYEKGGESYLIYKAAVKECSNNRISIELQLPKKGKTIWQGYTWFTFAEIDEGTGVCTMTFSPQLAAALLDMKRVYAKINLQDLGRLQSKYALRLFEMAKSYESLAGKDGNEQDAWYFERTVQEFKELFGLSDDIYKETKYFRQRIIEDPIKEINKAGIGVKITTEGIKQGRQLSSIRLNCKKAPRKTQAKCGRKKKEVQLELADIKIRQSETLQEKEMEHLKELYPKEFEAFYAKELEKPSFLPPENEFRRQAAEAVALALLRTKYGIVK